MLGLESKVTLKNVVVGENLNNEKWLDIYNLINMFVSRVTSRMALYYELHRSLDNLHCKRQPFFMNLLSLKLYY